MPLMAPVAELIERPLGSVGETLKESGDVPPPPVTGVNAVGALFCVNVTLGIDCVAVAGVFTVSWKVLLAFSLLASVTVTVKLLAAWVTVGEPVMAPVDAFKLSPAGRLGETLYDNGAVPPEPVTGVKFAATFWVSVTDAIDCVAATAELTTWVKLDELVAKFASPLKIAKTEWLPAGSTALQVA